MQSHFQESSHEEHDLCLRPGQGHLSGTGQIKLFKQNFKYFILLRSKYVLSLTTLTLFKEQLT